MSFVRPIFKTTIIIEDGKGLTQTLVFEKTLEITTAVEWEDPAISFSAGLKDASAPAMKEFSMKFKPLPNKEGVYFTDTIVSVH